MGPTLLVNFDEGKITYLWDGLKSTSIIICKVQIVFSLQLIVICCKQGATKWLVKTVRPHPIIWTGIAIIIKLGGDRYKGNSSWRQHIFADFSDKIFTCLLKISTETRLKNQMTFFDSVFRFLKGERNTLTHHTMFY